VIGMYQFQTGQRLTVPGSAANELEIIRVQ
jgi:hypothetical protein